MVRRLISTTLLLAAPVSGSTTARHSYDALGRLIKSDVRTSGGGGSREIYSYDRAGNRSRFVSSGPFKPVRIGAGQDLQAGEGILSNDTRFLLVLQSDSNLVLYDQVMTPIWNASTQNGGATRASMQQDGNFVLYRSDGSAVWSTSTNGSGGSQLVV